MYMHIRGSVLISLFTCDVPCICRKSQCEINSIFNVTTAESRVKIWSVKYN